MAKAKERIAPPKGNFIISTECEQQLIDLQQQFGLSKSDSVRRGVALLHDYLCKNLEPSESKQVEVSIEA